MNVMPPNAIQRTKRGGMDLLPLSEKWKSAVLRSGEVLCMSSEDLKCCFYVHRLPVAWRPYFAFPTPVNRKALGLSGEGEVYLKRVHECIEHERTFNELWTQCQRCQGSLHQDVLCSNSDCPIFYKRKKVQADLRDSSSHLQRFDVDFSW